MNRVEICGNIASGKTTLTQQFSRENHIHVFENFKNNPFYEAFYSDPASCSFETELTFLLQHYHSIKVNQDRNKTVICDFSISLDLVYADVNLTGNRHHIFIEVVDEIINELSYPQNVIYLRCPESILLERIKERSRAAEVTIKIDYLKDLSKAMEARMNDISSQTKIITINSGLVDFRTSIVGIPELMSL